MKLSAKLLTAFAATAIGLAASIPAHADGDGWKRHHRGHHQKHWKHGHPGHVYYGHRHYGHGYVVRERVIVERPVYYAPRPVYVERHVHYPPPRYPGVVVSVDIPPIVFPIR